MNKVRFRPTHCFFLILTIVFISWQISCDTTPESDSVGESGTAAAQGIQSVNTLADWNADVMKKVGIESYRIRSEGEALFGFNQSQRFYVDFDSDGLTVSSLPELSDWIWTWSLKSIGRDDISLPQPPVEPQLGVCDDEMEAGFGDDCLRLVHYDRGNVIEWYANRPDRVEQGFEVYQRPEGNGNLVFEGRIDGDLVGFMNEEGQSIAFTQDGVEILSYSDLIVYDASGRRLDAWIEFKIIDGNSGTIRLVIDDESAVYPLFVDPGLSTGPSWSYIGTATSSFTGTAVSSAGDVNNDGYDDIIIGAYRTGYVYLFFGRSVNPGTRPDQSLTYGGTTGNFGLTLDGRCDFNRDGYDDIIVGAPGMNRALAYYGSSSGLGTTPRVLTSSITNFARSVACGGDVNRDGYDDAVIGSPSNAAIYVYHGTSSGLPPSATYYRRGTSGTNYGFSVAGLGDTNRDRIDDVIVGAYSSGRAYCYLGTTSGLSSSPRTLSSTTTNFGYTVAGAGDVNRDGYKDALVGCGSYSRAYLYYGSSSGINPTVRWSVAKSGTSFGWSLAGVGDVNGDLYGDFMVGAPRYTNGQSSEGRAFLYLGASTPSTTESWKWEPNVTNARFGTSVDGAGDVNNDGASDAIAGAPYYSSYRGRVYLFKGDCSGGCLISGYCYYNGQKHPSDPCLRCDASVSGTTWSPYDGVSCDDGLYCNGTDTCQGGTCSVHSGDPCTDDGVFCNGTESCDETNDQCVSSGDPCADDGLWCNGAESCDETNDQCDIQNVPDCSDDGVYCNGTESCDDTIDQCVSSGDPCADDGQYCNGAESCDEVNDQCLSTGNPCPDDGLYCNGTESCDETNDQCDTTGNPCIDDGQYCNGAESCDEANDQCLSTGNPCPDDGQYCNGTESCDETADQCVTTGNPCPDDSQYCNGQEFCDELGDQCMQINVPQCNDDGFWCNGAEYCDETNDQCGHQNVPDCNDGIDCTVDSCDDINDTCVNAPDDSYCDDGVDCTVDSCVVQAGVGTFDPIANYYTAQYPTALAMGDLNGDGFDDAVVGVRDQDLFVHMNNGDGTFGHRIFLHTPNAYTTSVAIGDLNGDSAPDIVATFGYSSGYSVFYNNGDGTFGPQIYLFPANLGTTSISIIDLNLDGFADIASVAYYGANITVSLNDGNGNFPIFQTYHDAGTNVHSMKVSDLNNDSYPDIVVTNAHLDSISVLLNQGDGTFTPNTEYPTGDRPVFTAIGDIDSDGHMDVVTSNLYSENISILINSGNGTFSSPIHISIGPNPTALASGDINGDGMIDLAVAINAASIVVLYNKGNNEFYPSTRLSTIRNYGPQDIKLIDLNGDNVLDLATILNAGHSLAVFTQFIANGCVNMTNDSYCDDGAWCNGWETCDLVNDCQPGTPVTCNDDGVWCNGTEFCDEANDQCDSAGDPCPDDGEYCTGSESCDEANDQCVNSGDPCPDDSLYCNGQEFCDETGDQCMQINVPQCPDDGSWCNGTEYCDENSDQCASQNAPNCSDDGLFCNGTESCDESADQCVSSGDPCPDDGFWCNGAEICDEAGDQCTSQNVPDCDDGVTCTDDFCDDNADVCRNFANDGNCNDGQWCNGTETCDPAFDCQQGAPVNCDDDVDCTTDSCDETNDQCVNAPDDAYCNDGLFCTGAEACDTVLGCESSGDPCNVPVEYCDEDDDACYPTGSGEFCVSVCLNGYWDSLSSSFRPGVIDFEFYDAGMNLVDSFIDVPVDSAGESCANVRNSSVSLGNYFVVIRHYNHLDMISASTVPVDPDGANPTFDFTDQSLVACGAGALIFEPNTNGGTYCMKGGDATGDNTVNILDYALIGLNWNQPSVAADFTGDGQCNIYDYAVYGQNQNSFVCADLP